MKNELGQAIEIYKRIVALEDKLEASKEILEYLVSKIDDDDIEEYYTKTTRIENESEKRYNNKLGYIRRQGYAPNKIMMK